MSTKEGYTEYGYRGLEEIRRLQSEIETLKKRIEQLESDDDEIDVDTFNPGGTDQRILLNLSKCANSSFHVGGDSTILLG